MTTSSFTFRAYNMQVDFGNLQTILCARQGTQLQFCACQFPPAHEFSSSFSCRTCSKCARFPSHLSFPSRISRSLSLARSCLFCRFALTQVDFRRPPDDSEASWRFYAGPFPPANLKDAFFAPCFVGDLRRFAVPLRPALRHMLQRAALLGRQEFRMADKEAEERLQIVRGCKQIEALLGDRTRTQDWSIEVIVPPCNLGVTLPSDGFAGAPLRLCRLCRCSLFPILWPVDLMRSALATVFCAEFSRIS